MRRLKFLFVAALTAGCLLFGGSALSAQAATDYYYIGGMTAGFSLSAGGVEIVGFKEVVSEQGAFCPATEAGMRTGDLIVAVDGIGESTAAYLRCISLFYDRVKFGKGKTPELFSAEAFGAYLSERFSCLSDEVVEIYCLDAHNRIRFSKRFTSNQADKVRLAPEEVSKFIVGRHPYGLVLAHNHPKGSSNPSGSDDNFTAQIQMLCSINNIRLYDHLIVGEDGWYSYYLTGRMEEIKRAFSVQNIIGKRL